MTNLSLGLVVMWYSVRRSCLLTNMLVTKYNTGRFIMFSVITNIYNKKTKRPTLMESFRQRKLKKVFFIF